MKSPQVILLFLLSLLTFSCVDDLSDFGSEIRPITDQIVIGADTFHLDTKNFQVDSMYSRPDSFLLGSFYDEKFGTTQADILAQFNFTKGFEFPPASIADTVVADSACLFLQYDSYFGDPYSPIEVSAYQINLDTLAYAKKYYSNIDPKKYTDFSSLLGRRVFTAKDAASTRSKLITIKLSKEFVDRMFADSVYKSSASFNKCFKGMYITTKFGTSSMLNVGRLFIEYYYHYTYKTAGANTVNTKNMAILFPANKEVRQVNRICHPDRNEVIKERDSVNYVVSPANMYTQIDLPMGKITQKIDNREGFAGKKKMLNSAMLKVKLVDMETATLAMPVVKYMLLIKKSEVDNFFAKKELPTDTSTCAVMATLASSKVDSTGTYEYSYNFNLAKIIANDLKMNSGKEVEEMMLVPLSVTATSTGSIKEVRPQYMMSGVTIRSGKNIDPKKGKQTEPMMLKLIYSGF